MKGVTCVTVEHMYLLEFDSYDALVEYVHLKRPSQLSISFDGEKLTGSIPVAAYSVSDKSWG
jgi:hypothetical protein